MKTLALLSIWLALPLLAQDQKPVAPASVSEAKPQVPSLSTELIKEYYKALAHKAEADAIQNAAAIALNEKIKEIRAACHEQVELKQDGEPKCKEPAPETK